MTAKTQFLIPRPIVIEENSCSLGTNEVLMDNIVIVIDPTHKGPKPQKQGQSREYWLSAFSEQERFPLLPKVHHPVLDPEPEMDGLKLLAQLTEFLQVAPAFPATS